MVLRQFNDNNYEEFLKYREDLIDLFSKYFYEVHKDDFIGNRDTIIHMFECQLLYEYKTYWILYDDQEVPIGLLTAFILNQYGNTTPVLYVDYMYIVPKARSSKAIMYLYQEVGRVAKDLNMDVIGTTYVTSSNKRNNQIVGGEVIAEVTQFSQSKFLDTLNKYQKRINK